MFSQSRDKTWKQNNYFKVIYSDSILSITNIVYQSVYSKLCIKDRKYNEGKQEE